MNNPVEASATIRSGWLARRASRLGEIEFRRAGGGQCIADRFHPDARDHFAHQLAVPQQSGADEPLQNGACSARQPHRKFGFLTRHEQAGGMLDQRRLDPGNQARQSIRDSAPHPVVEPGDVGQEEVLDRRGDTHPAVDIGGRSLRDQRAGSASAHIIHFANIGRHAAVLGTCR
ncbi:hypothetical protein [Sphingomonas aliaeris]|uniref:hypothetical protein n=1 Tax=Sphingomonas aliaeris TaxID=2759526 RepID=UPI001CECE15A|nr:hypothetical protein [Sphingomonas aliaeris]